MSNPTKVTGGKNPVTTFQVQQAGGIGQTELEQLNRILKQVGSGGTGSTGPQGPQGPKGETGATGPAGADGSDGIPIIYEDEETFWSFVAEGGDLNLYANNTAVGEQLALTLKPNLSGTQLFLPQLAFGGRFGIVRAEAGTGELGTTAGSPVLIGEGGTGANNAADARTNLELPDGVWTPTITAVANIASTGAIECMYARHGGTVLFSGRFTAQATAAASTVTTIRLSLPVASTLTSFRHCLGVANNYVDNVAAEIIADIGSGLMEITWESLSTANRGFCFSGSYRIL